MLPNSLAACNVKSRWAFSVNPSVESAVTSTSLLHCYEHLCKHRATAAKHRCWQTVNTPPHTHTHNPKQCAAFKLLLNCLLVLSPPQPLRNHAEHQSGPPPSQKTDKIDYSIYFPSRKIGDREGMSSASAACFCLEYSPHAISSSNKCPIL